MTGLVVTYNTRALLQRAIESVRLHHPQLDIIIVDGSASDDPCFAYTSQLRKNPLNKVYQVGYNIGHGQGMHFGIERCDDTEVLVFDSDIVMLRSPVSAMLSLLDPSAYGVGWLTAIGRDGFDYGTYDRHFNEPAIPYLHPYFMLLNVQQYRRYAPFVHHGAPCYKAMIDIFDRGHSSRALRSYAGLTGHTTGFGINWTGKPNPYIQHDFGGTRQNNRAHGRKEIEGQWQR
jgi:glycosyltransferase involved in cell wall biosynthesis